jgi:hypothetical protein
VKVDGTHRNARPGKRHERKRGRRQNEARLVSQIDVIQIRRASEPGALQSKPVVDGHDVRVGDYFRACQWPAWRRVLAGIFCCDYAGGRSDSLAGNSCNECAGLNASLKRGAPRRVCRHILSV